MTRDFLSAAALHHQVAANPKKKLLRFRLDLAEANAHRRKGREVRCTSIIEKSRRVLLQALIDKHGVGKIMRHAHLIRHAMEKVELEEAAELFPTKG